MKLQVYVFDQEEDGKVHFMKNKQEDWTRKKRFENSKNNKEKIKDLKQECY